MYCWIWVVIFVTFSHAAVFLLFVITPALSEPNNICWLDSSLEVPPFLCLRSSSSLLSLPLWRWGKKHIHVVDKGMCCYHVWLIGGVSECFWIFLNVISFGYWNKKKRLDFCFVCFVFFGTRLWCEAQFQWVECWPLTFWQLSAQKGYSRQLLCVI